MLGRLVKLFLKWMNGLSVPAELLRSIIAPRCENGSLGYGGREWMRDVLNQLSTKNCHKKSQQAHLSTQLTGFQMGPAGPEPATK